MKFLAEDPLAEMRRFNQDKDPRHSRAVFTDEQLQNLLQTTEESARDWRGCNGKDRSAYYHAAVSTGLRLSALKGIYRSQFRLDSKHPSLEVGARHEKSGRGRTIPLPSDFVEHLKCYFRQGPEAPKAFRFPINKWDIVRGLRKDLKDAGIPYCQEEHREDGRTVRREVLDFHSLRHTYASRLARAGVSPRVAMELLDLRDFRDYLRYTHADFGDAVSAVALLPPVWSGSRQGST